MCTVTWARDLDGCGYQLLCNRDEKLTRSKALPPAAGVRDGVRFLAPRDPDGGGTWLSVNELGVTICLLNGAGSAPVQAKTRGSLVLGLAGSSSSGEAAERVESADLSRFAPFTLVAIDSDVSVCQWDGARCRVTSQNTDALLPLSSSSFDTERVCDRRRAGFRRFHSSHAGGLFDFHRSHGDRPSAYSTCMHREDAATVSFSWVSVSAAEIRLLYTPAAPCQWAPGETYRLPRATQGVAALCN